MVQCMYEFLLQQPNCFASAVSSCMRCPVAFEGSVYRNMHKWLDGKQAYLFSQYAVWRLEKISKSLKKRQLRHLYTSGQDATIGRSILNVECECKLTCQDQPLSFLPFLLYSIIQSEAIRVYILLILIKNASAVIRLYPQNKTRPIAKFRGSAIGLCIGKTQSLYNLRTFYNPCSLKEF